MEIQLITFLTLALLGSHTESSPSTPGTLQTFTLEELVPLRQEFYPERLSVQWISDTEYIYSESSGEIKKYDALNDKSITVLDAAVLNNLSSYVVSTFSKDGKYVLLATNRRKVYRYSSIAEYAVYDLEHQRLMNVTKGDVQAVVWGEGRSLAYVQGNNVYYLNDVSNPDDVTALTDQGVPGEVYFGITDWIYEEEVFNSAEALWFSPMGTHLAVASFNDTGVESVAYPFYGNPVDITNQYTHTVVFKYPKVGRANPVVGLRVIRVTDLTQEAWNIPAPVDAVGADHILARVNWATDTNLIVLWMNRRQSVSVLVNCDLVIDKCSIVKERAEINGWIEINNPFFDASGSKIVEIEPLYVEDQRFLHASRYDFKTLYSQDLSPFNSTVTEILGWNAERDSLYYIVAPVEVPWERQLWTTSNGVARCVTCKDPNCQHVSAMFSPNVSYGILTCSSTNSPPKGYLYDSKNDTMRELISNDKLVKKLSQYHLPMPLFNIITLANNMTAHIKLLLPPNLEKNKRYPMIVRVYAGPGTTRVKDNYNLEYYNTYLASNRSFIVASIDVRGSGVMGVDNMFAVNNALGTVEVTDTLAAISRLVELYSFIDAKRVGVWGWSYGGYATTMMLMQDKEHIVACGAAVAPVTSWLYYDSIYTERYMDTPQKNPHGYQQSDLMLLAEKLRGRRYLLIHGTGDDNVHYQHSLQLAKVLQHADIAFDQMSYTDESHSLLGVSRHFYHTLDHFWTECFNSVV